MNITHKIILLTIALMPFMASIFPQYTHLSMAPEHVKLVWGIIGVSVFFIAYFYQQLKVAKFEFVKSSLYLPIVGFIVWNILSLIWVSDTYLAIIMLGQFITTTLIYIIIINIFKNDFQIEKITTYLIISMMVVSIIGLIQYYFPLNEFWINFYWQVASPGATFGNKNMASHFIVMVLPLTLIRLFSANRYTSITGYSTASLVGFMFLIHASAKQAYLAVLIQLFILMLVLILDYWKNKDQSLVKVIKFKIYKGIVSIFILSVLFFISSYGAEGWNDKNSVSTVVKNISINNSSATARIPAWINTLEMIKEHPLIGVGVGQWQHKYPQYYDRISEDVIFNEHTRLQKLHNDYLEILANVGIIGYIFLIALLILIIQKIWNILINVNNKNRFEALGLMLGLIGFSVIAVFSFPVRVFLPVFLVMVYIAMIDYYSLNGTRKIINLSCAKKYKYSIFFIILISSYFIIKTSFFWLISESFRNNSEIYLRAEMNKEASFFAKNSLTYNNKDWRGFSAAGLAEFKLGHIKKSIPYFKKAIDISPFNTIVLLNLALAYESDGNYDMQKKVLDFVLRIDPNNVKANAKLVPILFRDKSIDDLEIVYSNLKTSFEYFKNRSNFGPYHAYVIYAAEFLKDYKYIEYIYHDAIKRGVVLEKDYHLKLAILNFYYLNNKKKGIIWYKKAIKSNPNINDINKIRELIDGYESNIGQ